jgi:VanZ family protein
MTAALVVVGLVPSAGPTLSSQSHWLAHFAAFVVLSAAWTRGLPQIPSLIVTLAIVAFALVHEAIEIVGHSHGYEMGDVAADAVGAMAGIWVTRLMMALSWVP